MLHIFPLMAPSPIKPKMLSHSFGHFSPGQNSKSSVKGYKILNHPIFFERIGNPPSNPQSNPPNCTQLHLQGVRKLMTQLCFEISRLYVDVLQNPFNHL